MALTQVSTDGIKNGTITGSDLATNIDLVDDQKLRLGAGNDLQIYHDGSNSYISEAGTGDLIIESSHIILKDSGTQVFETTNSGVRLQDNHSLVLGSGNDLQIYHDGNHSYIQDAGTGSLILVSNQVVMQNAAQTENMFAAIENAGCNLYYDNVKKFETTSDGVKISGAEGVEAILSFEPDEGDNASDKFRFRASDSAGFFLENGSSNDTSIKANFNGSVELYHANSKKFETTSAGSKVTGFLNVTTGIHIPDGGDNDNSITIGSSNDLRLYHDGTNSNIKSNTNQLNLLGNDIRLLNNGASKALIKAFDGGAAELYYDGSKKFETTSTGATVAGDLAVTSSLAKIKLNDTDGGDQYQIRNDAGTFIIRNGTDSKSVLTIDGACVTSLLNATPPATGVSVLHVSNSGSATTLGTAATFRVSNNGGNSAYSVFEAESGSGSIRLANDGKFYVSGASVFSNDIRVDRGTDIDGIVGQAYSGYFGLKHTDQTINSEYMMISNNSHTFISCTSGYSIYIRPSANSTVHETVFAHNVTHYKTNILMDGHAFTRNQHQWGHLEGGHNNIGNTDTRTSPIYTIGSAYNPNASDLSSMYGVGFSHGNASFTPSNAGWGAYIASDGDARIFLDASNGRVYFDSNLVSTPRFISKVSGEYGSLQINNGSTGGWGGFSIDGHSVFMSNGSSTSDYVGLYDDNANKWFLLAQRNSFLRLYWNSNVRLETTSAGVYITGTLTASSTKSFRISHPLSELSETKDLVHAAIEGPQMDLMYRGKVDLVNGTATVNIDTKSGMTEGTFTVLNRDVQCFTTNETGWTNVKGSVTGNKLTIIAEDNSCTDTISWMVIGERKDNDVVSSEVTDDNGDLIVEPDKQIISEDPKMDD